MGYLAGIDTGAVALKVSSNLFVVDLASTDSAFNDTTQLGNTLNLGAYSLGFEIGKNIDSKSNIGNLPTRIVAGSKKAVPFTLSSTFNKKRISDTDTTIGDYFTTRDVDTITYLTQWARSKNIIMLCYMPNTDSLSWLNHGQEIDFFSSQVKILYDVLWDKSTSSSSRGFQATTYGTYHYRIPLTVIGNYDVCAIPVIFENVSVKEQANSYIINVEVTGYVIENEGY